jgi:toxin HigB-1
MHQRGSGRKKRQATAFIVNCQLNPFCRSESAAYPPSWHARRSTGPQEHRESGDVPYSRLLFRSFNRLTHSGASSENWAAYRETEKIWEGRISRRLPQAIQAVARRKLRMLNNTLGLDDLRIPPANRLEALKGKTKGQHCIRINDQWRICFIRVDGNAHKVEIVDYH